MGGLSEPFDEVEIPLSWMNRDLCLKELEGVSFVPGWPDRANGDITCDSAGNGFTLCQNDIIWARALARRMTKERPSDEVAELIVETIAPAIDLVSFAKALIEKANIKSRSSYIPKRLYDAMMGDKYSPDVAEKIMRASKYQLKALMADVAAREIRLIGGYRTAMVRAIYKSEIVHDRNVLLSCMADSIFSVVDDGDCYMLFGPDYIPLRHIGLNKRA